MSPTPELAMPWWVKIYGVIVIALAIDGFAVAIAAWWRWRHTPPEFRPPREDETLGR